MYTARRASIVLAATLAMVFAGGSSSLTARERSPATVDDGGAAVIDEAGLCEAGVTLPDGRQAR